jgi:hypothetical protein
MNRRIGVIGRKTRSHDVLALIVDVHEPYSGRNIKTGLCVRPIGVRVFSATRIHGTEKTHSIGPIYRATYIFGFVANY